MEKKKMKKILALILALVMCVGAFTACGEAKTYDDLTIVDLGLERENFGIAFRQGSDMTRKVEDITLELVNAGLFETLGATYEVTGIIEKGDYTPKADPCSSSNDWAYIQAKGTLVIGITDYKPMDYKDEEGNWVGFDADYARAVCAKLGVTPVFKEIEWDYKLMALESKDIDCVWNGMTITDAIEAAADCTVPYMYNTQVAVILKDDADKFKSIEDLEGKRIAAEAGSAGEKVIQANDKLAKKYKAVTAQTDAILEVMSGSSKAAIVDLTLAKALIK
jgi:ABC-type amino acid transport substrate-binding protein